MNYGKLIGVYSDLPSSTVKSILTGSTGVSDLPNTDNRKSAINLLINVGMVDKTGSSRLVKRRNSCLKLMDKLIGK
jgi:hypothetical protein